MLEYPIQIAWLTGVRSLRSLVISVPIFSADITSDEVTKDRNDYCRSVPGTELTESSKAEQRAAATLGGLNSSNQTRTLV
jgi:hypothetical protein